eukprot:TRINITY_DN21751_c0_g1_i1.p1 TRINITY_DN21751_c0_g1~~TRINITY_DN21751_c0_g1_i1.p1  ORF type:complete len:555 (-),score=76.43 TRINITY_DN21751_c0_g1_i1:56-1720(-)
MRPSIPESSRAFGPQKQTQRPLVEPGGADAALLPTGIEDIGELVGGYAVDRPEGYDGMDLERVTSYTYDHVVPQPLGLPEDDSTPSPRSKYAWQSAKRSSAAAPSDRLPKGSEAAPRLHSRDTLKNIDRSSGQPGNESVRAGSKVRANSREPSNKAPAPGRKDSRASAGTGSSCGISSGASGASIKPVPLAGTSPSARPTSPGAAGPPVPADPSHSVLSASSSSARARRPSPMSTTGEGKGASKLANVAQRLGVLRKWTLGGEPGTPGLGRPRGENGGFGAGGLGQNSATSPSGFPTRYWNDEEEEGLPEMITDCSSPVIILDFDDTLMATTFVQQTILPGLPPLKRELPIDKASPHYAPLLAHAKVVGEVLREARKHARVAIVTLASTWWLTASAERYLPGLDLERLLEMLEITVYHADRQSQMAISMEKSGQDPAIVAKKAAMSCILKRFYSTSDISEWNVLSIGDSAVEIMALKECFEKECSSASSYGSPKQRLCKTVKFRETPTLEQLTQQLTDLLTSLPRLVAYEKDFDRMAWSNGSMFGGGRKNPLLI